MGLCQYLKAKKLRPGNVRTNRGRTSNDEHVRDIDNTGMVESFQYFDFSKSGNRHALFLIVHKDAFESHWLISVLVYGFVNLAWERIRC